MADALSRHSFADLRYKISGQQLNFEDSQILCSHMCFKCRIVSELWMSNYNY